MKLMILMAIFSCSFIPIVSGQTDKPVLKNITVEEFKKMLAAKDFILLDVHVPEGKHLRETDVFIPYDRVTENLNKLPDKNMKIIVYCRSGRMSAEAGQALVDKGYTDVYNVLGGYREMKKAGIPIEDNS